MRRKSTPQTRQVLSSLKNLSQVFRLLLQYSSFLGFSLETQPQQFPNKTQTLPKQYKVFIAKSEWHHLPFTYLKHNIA